MPASSRLADLFGIGSSLRRKVPLLPSEGRGRGRDGWQAIWENGMYGGYLTAAADPSMARVRVDLSWPGIRYATIIRIHADGSRYKVRGGDPATVLGAWARWDYEAPLDQDVTYEATSDERLGSTTSAGPVNVSSGGRFWLKSVANPALNIAVRVADKGTRTAPARASKLEPPLRPDAIYVYQVRATDKGVISLYAADRATEAAIRALLASGGPLILQYPAIAGGESLYLMVDAVGYNPPIRLSADLQNVISLPIDVIGRPDGAAQGGLGNSYADQAAAFDTYGQSSAAAASYLELSLMSF